MRLASVVRPFTTKVALDAQRDEVGRRVCDIVPINPKRSKRSDVVDIKRLPILLRCLTAILADSVALANRPHRRTPRWPVIRFVSTLPEDALLSATVSRISLRLARTRAISTAIDLAWFDREHGGAFGAGQRCASTRVGERLSKIRVIPATVIDRLPSAKAGKRAKPLAGTGSRPVDHPALLTGCVRNRAGVVCLRRARDRAVRTRPTATVSKHLPALRTRRLGMNCGVGSLALSRAVNTRLASVEGMDLLARRADARGFSVRVGNSSGFHKPKYIPITA